MTKRDKEDLILTAVFVSIIVGGLVGMFMNNFKESHAGFKRNRGDNHASVESTKSRLP